jgi:hypothetical protein
MTILSADTLLDVLNLIADGASVVEATAAIGASPKSKIIFAWLADSADAGEFDASPDPESPWAFEWNGKLDWFHLHYRNAQEHGRELRSKRKTPLRAELEELLARKRRASENIPLASSPPPPHHTPALVVDHVKVDPVMIDKPTPPRPSYAYRRAPPLDAVNTPAGPPPEGRFTVATHSYSRAERQAGKPSITDEGIKWN